ncbi:hypothetical protein B0T10DRAFT_40027 [Thelonectria olida]|uniref:PNPLA domain-containing protein n=1 Tax=Thelonectria olida TaxID=1576542 RepID=A0A9P8W782_9HYPO|nr:hypothetical protein B0T10DRAFT_40027 [Thelonectria olida]
MTDTRSTDREQRLLDPPINPVEQKGLCLLSFDGGGVKGLSSLYVLEMIMAGLNRERERQGLADKKPCEVFDLIGGTSTGGLIAIMLGRLQMDVGECIAAYTELMESIFGQQLRRFRLSLSGKIKSRFDSKKLKKAIEAVVSSKGFSATDLLNDGIDRGCKVFVCATSTSPRATQRLRSYSLPEKPGISCTICEAALATSAATGFFDPVDINGMKYVDGALGANNPVDEVEGEARDIWCPISGDLKPLVKCFISIGTGNPKMKRVEDRIDKFVSSALVGLATETADTAEKFVRRWGQGYEDHSIFRFNVDRGLEAVGLAEFQHTATIKVATSNYLEGQAQISQLRHLANNLKQKQELADRSFEDVVKEYHNRLIPPSIQPATPELTLPIRQPPAHCLIPFPKNKRFVGRTSTLDALDTMFFMQPNCPRVSVVGLGGMGKTQVALTFAYQVQEQKPNFSVFWVSALSENSFEQSYTKIATDLGVLRSKSDNENDGEENVKDLVRDYLSSPKAGPWFLILDNADDVDLVLGTTERPGGMERYLPESPDGRILFTTRSREIATAVSEGDFIELKEMSGEEARSVLGKSLQRQELLQDVAIEELLRELTWLPLAIVQAVAYLNRNHVSVSRYLELLRGTERETISLMSREFRDRTRYDETQHAVATTWMVSFDQILNRDETAATLLRFISCIEPKSIPRSLLPVRDSEEQLDFSIGTLCAYAFLSPRDGHDMFDMHSLVHLATRIWVQRHESSDAIVITAVEHVHRVFPSVRWENRSKWRVFLPHALKLLRESETRGGMTRSDLLLIVGKCLKEDGRLQEAIACHQESANWRSSNLPEGHEDILSAEYTLARTYNKAHQGGKAIELLEHIKAARRKALPEAHESRVHSEAFLGRVYANMGQYDKAIALLEPIVAIDEDLLAKDSWPRLFALNLLADVYAHTRQNEKAKKLLEDFASVAGNLPDHPGRSQNSTTSHLKLMCRLAGTHMKNRQVFEAIGLLESIFDVAKQLPAHHPVRLDCEQGLGKAYLEAGKGKEAIELLEHVAECRKSLHENGAGPIRVEKWLAKAYLIHGRKTEGISLLEEVVRKQSAYPEGDRERQQAIIELCRQYGEANRAQEAIELLEPVVALLARTCLVEDEKRLQCEEELAWLYGIAKKREKAIELKENRKDPLGRPLGQGLLEATTATNTTRQVSQARRKNRGLDQSFRAYWSKGSKGSLRR